MLLDLLRDSVQHAVKLLVSQANASLKAVLCFLQEKWAKNLYIAAVSYGRTVS